LELNGTAVTELTKARKALLAAKVKRIMVKD
jgi:hypothetical protein